MFQDTIRIGTMAGKGPKTADYIAQILPHGFESFEINFWQTLGETDLKKVACQVKDVLAGSDAVVSSLGIYGNPLMDDDKAKATRDGWKTLIDAAPLFGADVVCGFTGRIVGKPLPESLKPYKKVFEPLAKHRLTRV